LAVCAIPLQLVVVASDAAGVGRFRVFATLGVQALANPFRSVAELGLAVFRGLGRNKPHYLRDYNLLLGRLLATNSYDKAMQLCVGGGYEPMGRKEASLLTHLGLKDGHLVVDVGCGSGRLSSALGERCDIRYHGTDILQPLLDYARQHAPSSYRFTRVDRIAIPEQSDSADFVTLFSVATHLMHHETYSYLEEARRVAAPGGRIVVSFLEFANPGHWQIFANTLRVYRSSLPEPINTFIEASVFAVWAEKLGLELVEVKRGDTPWFPLDGSAQSDGGEAAGGLVSLGQSCAVLRKPG
jgi:ubiquinone/menaquinone biosynthesis C-methylase UbiE